MEKKYYVIGLGGYGSKLAEELSLKMKKDGSSVVSIAFDTDNYEIGDNACDYKFDLSAQGNFDFVVTNLLKKKNIKLFSDFDSIELNYAKCLHMSRGSSLWRLKAYICFINFMCDENNKKTLDSFIEKIAFNPSVESEIYFVGSLAGGTSTALTLPISLYFKKSFRELNYKNYKTIYFASTPDIFAVSLNAELKTKAYANAYATLSEINTVNAVAFKRETHKLNIGGDNMPFGELFNGTSGEYNYKACAPFNDIVLFDRMPGVTSVDNFRLTVCSYIYYYHKGLVNLEKNKSFDDMGIYSSFCVSELNYNLENNVNYVSKYITNKKINDEFNKAYSLFEQALNGNYLSGNSKEKISETEEFTHAVIKRVESLYDEKLDKPSILLNRNENYDFGEDISFNDSEIKYCDLIRKYFNELIKQNAEFIEINNKLNNSYFTKKEENKITFNSKNKKEKLNEFIVYYKDIYNKIKCFLDNLIEEYFNNNEIEKLIFEDDKLSIENIIKIDDKYIHPTLALVKLSHIFNILCHRQRAYSKLSDAEIQRSIIDKETPIKILELKDLLLTKKGYGSLSSYRLINVFETKKIEQENIINNKKKIKNIYEIKYPKKEEFYLISDLKNALNNCVDVIYGIFISKFTNAIEILINNYRKLYENTRLISNKLNNELIDLTSNDETSTVVYNARSSQTERLKDVNDYQKEFGNNYFSDIDDKYGKIVFEFVKDLEDEIGNDLNDITDKLFTSEKQLLKQSNFYKNLETKNVLSAMCEPKIDNYINSLLKRASNIRPHFITANKPTEIEGRTLYISKEVAEYVLSKSNELLLRETALDKAFEELLSNMGDFETQVTIFDGLSNSELFVIAKKCAVNLDSIIKINSENDIALYKAEYQKAINNKSEYSSEMWNPHIYLLDGKTELCNI
ncbi:MAG: hypothetical protein E7358_04975 [Clostridiales bacterium]|nr:hypothetical protein [Clostridiales bacterium]